MLDSTNERRLRLATLSQDNRDLIAQCRQTVAAFAEQRLLARTLPRGVGRAGDVQDVLAPAGPVPPKDDVPGPANYPGRPAGAVPYRAGLAVLVVDDNAASRYAISRTLQRAGYQTIQAAGGVEALQYAGKVAAVVLDVHLPDIHGLEVCHLLRRTAGNMFPIIHVSAVYIDREHRGNGIAAGADEYFVSPIEPQILVEAVDSLIAKYGVNTAAGANGRTRTPEQGRLPSAPA